MAWFNRPAPTVKRDSAPDPGAQSQTLLDRLLAAENAIAHGAYCDARCLLNEAENGLLKLHQQVLALLRANESLELRLQELARHRRAS